jgi:hypothetical protein
MCSCAIYPISNVYNMPIIHNLSNHAAILLSTEGPVSRVKHSFKFENWWIKEQDFQDHAKTAWFSYLNKLFFARTNHLAGILNIWCKRKKPLHQELNNLEEQIKKIRIQPFATKTTI